MSREAEKVKQTVEVILGGIARLQNTLFASKDAKVIAEAVKALRGFSNVCSSAEHSPLNLKDVQEKRAELNNVLNKVDLGDAPLSVPSNRQV